MVVAVVAVAVAACGSSDDTDSIRFGFRARTGGEATLAQTSQPDYLDPALSYTVNGWEPMWLVYTPLLTYPHVEGQAGAELIPGLAEELPEISEDGMTYTLTLRDGLKYSDGQDVVASDFEHTIKRVLNLESGGSPFYQVDRGRRRVPEERRSRGRHHGHRDRRQDRRDHDQADRARRRRSPTSWR